MDPSAGCACERPHSSTTIDKGQRLAEGIYWYQNDSGEFYELKFENEYSWGPEQKV